MLMVYQRVRHNLIKNILKVWGKGKANQYAVTSEIASLICLNADKQVRALKHECFQELYFRLGKQSLVLLFVCLFVFCLNIKFI